MGDKWSRAAGMADEGPDAPPGWTLGDIRKWGMKLEAVCKKQGCGEFVVFNLDGLIERFGADYPLDGRVVVHVR
jgi:hypothetical protein